MPTGLRRMLSEMSPTLLRTPVLAKVEQVVNVTHFNSCGSLSFIAAIMSIFHNGQPYSSLVSTVFLFEISGGHSDILLCRPAVSYSCQSCCDICVLLGST